MSVELYQKNLGAYDAEIAELSAAKAALDDEVATLHKELAQIENSITRHTSPAANKSKNTEIIRYKSDILRKSKEIDSFAHKIEALRKKRAKTEQLLQKAHQIEQLRHNKEVELLQQRYEKVAAAQRRAEPSLAPVYAAKSGAELDYDIFISAAREDTESFAAVFATALESRGLRVWYNKNPKLSPAPLAPELDAGLKKSRFAVLVLSPDYIAPERYWEKTSLEAALLMPANGKCVFPLLHRISKQELLDYSEPIARKFALTTALHTPAELASIFADLLK